MKTAVLSFLIALFSITTLSAEARTYQCYSCLAGAAGYTTKIYHRDRYEDRKFCMRSHIAYCRREMQVRYEDPDQCKILKVNKHTCRTSNERPDDNRPSPFCNYTSDCGRGEVCIGGICRDKNDGINNKCTQDSDCGGVFDRGRCVLGRCV